MQTKTRALAIHALSGAIMLYCCGAFSTEVSNEKICPLIIFSLQDMYLGELLQGAPAETVSPDIEGSGGSAVFRIQGCPFRMVSIHIPMVDSYLRREGGRENKGIRLSSFKSFPAEGEPFQLNAVGQKKIALGATRNKVDQRLRPGTYSGELFLTIIYQ